MRLSESGGLSMESDKKLDLRGIIEPCCFLQCKSTLAAMNTGQVLEISLLDSGTVKDLVTILERSGEIILDRKIEGDHQRLWVRKCSVAQPKGERRNNVKCGS